MSADQNPTTIPSLPPHWRIASIIVRRDAAWGHGGTLTYDALLERDGGYLEARGVGSDPVAAVRSALHNMEVA